MACESFVPPTFISVSVMQGCYCVCSLCCSLQRLGSQDGITAAFGSRGDVLPLDDVIGVGVPGGISLTEPGNILCDISNVVCQCNACRQWQLGWQSITSSCCWSLMLVPSRWFVTFHVSFAWHTCGIRLGSQPGWIIS